MKQVQALIIAGAIFMIGLGIIFLTNNWFPGIFFLIGATITPQALVKGWSWYVTECAIFMIGMGIVFTGGFSIGMLFLVFGAMLVYGALTLNNSPLAVLVKNDHI